MLGVCVCGLALANLQQIVYFRRILLTSVALSGATINFNIIIINSTVFGKRY